MTSNKRIVLSTFGSFGDIHPYIAIALELQTRGHSPVMATSEVYREKLDAAGIEFHPIRPNMPSYDDEAALVKLSAQLIDPNIGTEKVLALFTENPREVYDDLNQAAEGADLLLTHPLPLVGPIVAQKRRLPWVSSVLAPISLFSAYDPPVPPQMPALVHLVRLHPMVGRLFFRLASYKLESIMNPIFDLRRELGLPRGEQPLLAGQHSPTRVLALFSSVLARPQLDWPRNTLVTGFPFYDRRDYFSETESPAGLLEFLDAGPPPIIFTLGSAAFWVAEDFYRDSIKAAQELGQRALLLIGHARNLPKEPLPVGMAAFEYAPFGEVLPRASIVVHQGGVGTTGQGLRSGRPTLIVPHAHDQFDNADRVARLGCGRTIVRPRYNARNAATELGEILKNPGYQTRAAEVGGQVQSENGAVVAADAIEEALQRGTKT